MTRPALSLLTLLLSLLLVGCSSHSKNPWATKTFSFLATDTSGATTQLALSDQKALLFSSQVADAFRSRAGISRRARSASGSVQVALAALAGANGAFAFSDSALAGLGLGSALIPDFQGIFSAKERAEAYTDAVRLIETAQNEFLAYNQDPLDYTLTQNGVTLIQRTQASIHVVEKTLAGRIPSIVELQQATEPMTAAGAKQTEAGTKIYNYIPASGDARPKPSAPGPTGTIDLDPNARDGITTATPVDVQADQRMVADWITAANSNGEFKLLRQFVAGAGGDTSTLKDTEVVTKARRMVRNATNRTEIDKLIKLKDTPLVIDPEVDPTIDPTAAPITDPVTGPLLRPPHGLDR